MVAPPESTEALVLARYNVKDDRIVTLLTPRDGRLPAVARRARRGPKHTGAVLEPLTRVDVTYQVRKGRDLVTLKEAVCRDAFSGLKSDLVRTAMASVMAELLLQFTVDFDPAPTLYALGLRAFTSLDDLKRPVTEAHLLLFELRVLALAGSLPPFGQLFGEGHPGVAMAEEWFAGRWVSVSAEVLNHCLRRTEAHIQDVVERPLKSRALLTELVS